MLPNMINDITQSSFYRAFDYSTDPIAMTDTDIENGFFFTYVNPAFCRETGYTKEELIGQSPRILQGPKSDREMLDELKTTLKEGNDFVGQTINYRKDRTEFIVKWSISPLKDSNNETIAYLSIHKIMTPQVRAEDENFLLNDILQQAPGMILVMNMERKIIYVNDAYIGHVGHSREELINSDISILEAVKSQKESYKNKWDSLIHYEKYEGVLVIKKKDNSTFFDKQKITTIKDGKGNPKYFLTISHDITKLKEALAKKK